MTDLKEEDIISLRKSIEKALEKSAELDSDPQKVISDALDQLAKVTATADLLKVISNY